MDNAGSLILPPLRLSVKAQRTPDPPISYLMSMALGNPDLISFAAGFVDSPTLPVEECARLTRDILSDATRGRSALQYGTTIGLKPLRHRLLRHLEQLESKQAGDMGLSADNILLSTGSQQALYLIADVLLDEGDIAIAASPSYFVYTGTLQSLGARVLTVPMDDCGMDVDAVEATLARLQSQAQLSRVRFIYCTSFYQNPTGLTLSAQRRPRLLEIARRYSHQHRILVVEDAAYRELRYDGPALPSIKSYDAENRYTVLTQTFSKPFAPGLKLGYTAMPADLIAPVLRQKGNHDFGSPNLAQEIALASLEDGAYHRQVERLRDHYRAKRDALLRALKRHMPRDPAVRWTHPHGGLYVWLTLPETIDTSRGAGLFEACLRAGVMYVPGEYCFQPDAEGRIPRHHMRLCFGPIDPARIEPGIQRLAAAIAGQLRQRSRTTT